jgi:hypothetical protein
MKMAVFWVVAPCRLVEVYQCFRGACCLHHQGDENRENLKSQRKETDWPNTVHETILLNCQFKIYYGTVLLLNFNKIRNLEL